jgi:dolichyl-phosphate-mannose--protein O-mannosyl transferase
LTTPAWQSYDETGHYTYARYLAVNGRLPPLGTKIDRYDETHQPPLYYVLVALAISGIDVSDNFLPDTKPLGNVYLVELDPRLEGFPYQGTALAIRVGRLVSAVLSTLAVACTYFTVITLFPKRRDIALLATAIHAFWPLFLLLSGAITNDISIGLFASLTLLVSSRLLLIEQPRSRRTTYLGMAGAITGCILSKDSGIAFPWFGLIVVGYTTICDPRRHASFVWRNLLFFVIPLIALLTLATILSDGRTIRQFTTFPMLMKSRPI